MTLSPGKRLYDATAGSDKVLDVAANKVYVVAKQIQHESDMKRKHVKNKLMFVVTISKRSSV